VTNTPTKTAIDLFAPLGPAYERWAHILSLGQDRRWRRSMVSGLDVEPGAMVLDVAAGTGSITRMLDQRGTMVISLDQSPEMLMTAVAHGARGVLATAEALPFAGDTFDAVTFGYLLRYVDDVEGSMTEIARVLRPGGMAGMVEFGRPSGIWHPPWWVYTRVGLPLAGLIAGKGWYRVGRFLGPSIDDFASRYPPSVLADSWRAAGFTDIEFSRPSLGGGLVMWGRKA